MMFKKPLLNVEINQLGISKPLKKKIFSWTTDFKKIPKENQQQKTFHD